MYTEYNYMYNSTIKILLYNKILLYVYSRNIENKYKIFK